VKRQDEIFAIALGTAVVVVVVVAILAAWLL
jgi:hypothetical protein